MKFKKLIIRRLRRLSGKNSFALKRKFILKKYHGKILRPLPKDRKKEKKDVNLLPAKEVQLITFEPPVQAIKAQDEIPSFLMTPELLKPNQQLKDCIEAFLLNQNSPHTQRAYGKDLKKWIKYLHSRHYQFGPEKINRLLIVSYKDMLLGEEMQHTSIDRHLSTLRGFFKWCVDEGVIEKNPALGVRFLNPKRLSKTNAFTDEEVRKLLKIPDLHTRVGSLHYAILMVLFYCGLRRSELCELKTSNLGEERNHKILRLRGKGDKERVVVVIPPVWNAIVHYLKMLRKELSQDQVLFTPLKNNRTHKLEKPLDPSAIYYIVTKYAKFSGVSKKVSPHSCRATAISNARDHNVPDRAIQEFAGWSSPDMITHYDKRKTSVENSAAHSISYGVEKQEQSYKNEITSIK